MNQPADANDIMSTVCQVLIKHGVQQALLLFQFVQLEVYGDGVAFLGPILSWQDGKSGTPL